MTSAVPNDAVDAVKAQLPMFHATAIMAGLALVLVMSRLYSHFRLIKSNTIIDDAFIVAAWIFAVGNVGIAYSFYNASIALLSTPQPTVANFKVVFRLVWAFIWVYSLGLAATKISILFQYRRIFVVRTFQIVNNVLLALMIPYSIVTAFLGVFECWPISAAWTRSDPTVSPGRCINLSVLFTLTAVINIVTDIAILVLPLPVVASLRLPMRQRIGVFVLFTLGGALLMVISVTRLLVFYRVNLVEVVTLAKKNNELMVWSCVEMTAAIICSSIPALKPLMIKLFPQLGSRGSGREDSEEAGVATIGSRRVGSNLDDILKAKHGVGLQTVEMHIIQESDEGKATDLA